YCGADGRIRYLLSPKLEPGSEGYLVIEGPLGRETEQRVYRPKQDAGRWDRTRPRNNPNTIDRSDCEPLAADLRMDGREWVIDANREYRLDFGKVPDSGQSIVLERADGRGELSSRSSPQRRAPSVRTSIASTEHSWCGTVST